MPINRAFQRLKKPMKDGFHAVFETIYSGIKNNALLYIVYRNEVYDISKNIQVSKMHQII